MDTHGILIELAAIGTVLSNRATAQTTPHAREYHAAPRDAARAAWKAIRNGADAAAELRALRWRVAGAEGERIAALLARVESARAVAA